MISAGQMRVVQQFTNLTTGFGARPVAEGLPGTQFLGQGYSPISVSLQSESAGYNLIGEQSTATATVANIRQGTPQMPGKARFASSLSNDVLRQLGVSIPQPHPDDILADEARWMCVPPAYLISKVSGDASAAVYPYASAGSADSSSPGARHQVTEMGAGSAVDTTIMTTGAPAASRGTPFSMLLEINGGLISIPASWAKFEEEVLGREGEQVIATLRPRGIRGWWRRVVEGEDPTRRVDIKMENGVVVTIQSEWFVSYIHPDHGTEQVAIVGPGGFVSLPSGSYSIKFRAPARLRVRIEPGEDFKGDSATFNRLRRQIFERFNQAFETFRSRHAIDEEQGGLSYYDSRTTMYIGLRGKEHLYFEWLKRFLYEHRVLLGFPD